MSEQVNNNSKRGRISKVVGLFILLIVFPLGSYIYLKKGFNYQKSAMDDLRKEQKLQHLDVLQQLKGVEHSGELDGKMHILGLLPQKAAGHYPEYGEVLFKLHEQFDKPENIEFWTIFEGQDSSYVENYCNFHSFPEDSTQLFFWTAAPKAFNTFVDGLGLIGDEQTFLNKGLFVMVDDSSYVRRAFTFDDMAVKQLVERTAILLPERSKPKPEIRRNKEK